MQDLGASGEVASSELLYPGNRVATPPPPPPLGSVQQSAASSWRYASASMGESADSDAYSGLLASVAADEGVIAGADAAERLPSFGATSIHTGGAAFHSSAGGRTQPSNQQLWSPSKRPQLPVAPPQPYSAAPTGPISAAGHMPMPAVSQGMQAAVSGPPQKVDPASYAAGERAALMSAFQQALPSQQALGQLFSAMESLHSRLEEEAAQWRQMQLGSSRTAGLVEAVVSRLDALEHVRIPQLQERADAAASRPPEQLLELLTSLQQVVTLLAHQRQLLSSQPAHGAAPRAASTLHWLLLAAAGYGQSLLSRADVAALVLSRKILLSVEAGGDASSRRGRATRTVLGAALFVLSVEAAWQAQRRLMHPLPAVLRPAAAPLRLGLRVTRVAVWSAGTVLAAAAIRASCAAVSDSACSAVEAAAASLKLPDSWAQRLPAVWALQRWRSGRGDVQQHGAAAVAASHDAADAAAQEAAQEAAAVEEGGATGAVCSASIPAEAAGTPAASVAKAADAAERCSPASLLPPLPSFAA